MSIPIKGLSNNSFSQSQLFSARESQR